MTTPNNILGVSPAIPQQPQFSNGLETNAANFNVPTPTTSMQQMPNNFAPQFSEESAEFVNGSNIANFFKNLNYVEVLIYTAILTTAVIYGYSKILEIKQKKEDLKN